MESGGKIEILAGYQTDGIIYQLRPRSLKRIKESFPESNPVRSIFIRYETKEDLERIHDSIDKQVLILLTGLGDSQINDLGGYKVVDPSTDRVVVEQRGGREPLIERRRVVVLALRHSKFGGGGALSGASLGHGGQTLMKSARDRLSGRSV